MRLPKRFPLLLSAALLSAGLVTSSAAMADEAMESDAGAMIIVTATRDNGYLAARTASATRTDTPLLDVPQSVDIITRDRLDDQAMLSISDALRYIPGTIAGQGEGNRDQPTLRGNSSTSSFFVDGLRDDVQYYRDFYNSERLEILKGPNALIFGRGGGGGVINRVSKTPQGDLFIAGDASVDTFGAWRLGADINAPLSGGTAARIAAVYEDGASHRDVYDLERYAVNPTLGFDLGGKGKIVIGYEYAHDERVADRGIPSLNGAPVAGFRDTFFGLAGLNISRFDGHIVSIAADYALSDNLTVRNRSRYGDYDKLYRNLFPATAVTAGFVGVEAYADATARENLLTQTDLVWKVATGGLDHTLLAGFELGRQTTTSERVNGTFAIVPGGTSLRTPVALSRPVPAARTGVRRTAAPQPEPRQYRRRLRAGPDRHRRPCRDRRRPALRPLQPGFREPADRRRRWRAPTISGRRASVWSSSPLPMPRFMPATAGPTCRNRATSSPRSTRRPPHWSPNGSTITRSARNGTWCPGST